MVAHLVTQELEKGRSPVEAVAAALPRLRGAFALAFLFAGEDDLLIGARKGSPLAIGYGDGEMYLGSDAIALAPFTDTISYLEDGDWAVLTRNGVEVRDAGGAQVERAVIKSLASSAAGRQGQPSPLHGEGDLRAARGRRPHARPLPRHGGRTRAACRRPAHSTSATLDRRRRSSAAAPPTTPAWSPSTGSSASRGCRSRSTSRPSSATARRRCRPGRLAIFVSQSGETADTLATLRYAKEQRQHVVAVVNVPTSTIARESDVVMPTLAGPEIGVASTKAFTCQLAVLACLALAAGRARGVLSAEDERKLVRALIEVPRLMTEALALEPQIELLARDLAKCRDVLYLGRGTSYPIALEGALKLKEISYIHAEGYAAGELKHGPIALIDEKMPVIVIAPYDRVFEKTVSNMQEVAARGGKIILVTDPAGAREARAESLVEIDAARRCRPRSRRWSTPSRCSSSPTIRRLSWAPTSTSRATSPSR